MHQPQLSVAVGLSDQSCEHIRPECIVHHRSCAPNVCAAQTRPLVQCTPYHFQPTAAAAAPPATAAAQQSDCNHTPQAFLQRPTAVLGPSWAPVTTKRRHDPLPSANIHYASHVLCVKRGPCEGACAAWILPCVVRNSSTAAYCRRHFELAPCSNTFNTLVVSTVCISVLNDLLSTTNLCVCSPLPPCYRLKIHTKKLGLCVRDRSTMAGLCFGDASSSLTAGT